VCLISLIITCSNFWKCLKQRPVLGFLKGKKPKIEKPSVLINKTCQRVKRNQKFCAQLFVFYSNYFENRVYLYIKPNCLILQKPWLWTIRTALHSQGVVMHWVGGEGGVNSNACPTLVWINFDKFLILGKLKSKFKNILIGGLVFC
jgi:hypothetical protein